MSIEHDDTRLTDYVLGELDGSELAAFEAELAGSTDLRRAVDETRAAVEALTGALAAEPSVTLSDAQRAAVLTEAKSVDGPGQAEVAALSAGRPRRVNQLIALAAALLIGCGVGYVVGVDSAGDVEVALSPAGLVNDQTTVVKDDSSAVAENGGAQNNTGVADGSDIVSNLSSDLLVDSIGWGGLHTASVQPSTIALSSKCPLRTRFSNSR